MPSHPLFQALLHNIPQLVWLKDLQGRYLACNPAFASFVGLPQAQLLGQTASDLYPPELAQAHTRQDHASLQSVAPVVAEIWSKAAQGPQRALLEITKVALRDAQGQPTGILGIARNITSPWSASQFERLRSQVLELLAHGADLAYLLQTLADGLRQLRPEQSCLLACVEAAPAGGSVLQVVASAGLSEAFIDLVNGMAVAPGGSACAAAAFSGQQAGGLFTAHTCQTYACDVSQLHGLGACWAQPFFDASGQVLGVFSAYTPQTQTPSAADFELLAQLARLAGLAVERHRVTQQLRANEASFRALAEHTPEAILVHRGGRILYLNPAALRLFGADTSADLLGTAARQRVAPAHLTQQLARLQVPSPGQSSPVLVESRFCRLDGSEFEVAVQSGAIVYDGQSAVHVSFRDISAHKAQERQLWQLAHFDTLTGLPNRALHADRLQQAMLQASRRGLKLALAFVDLDGFKQINDTHGHEAGDHLLMMLARRMRQALRETDTLSRLGGDEFAAILVDLTQEEDCDPLLQRLLSAANQPVQLDNALLQVSASVGVAFYPQEDEVSPEQLLRLADLAMYRAKQGGKNQFQLSGFPDSGFADTGFVPNGFDPDDMPG